MASTLSIPELETERLRLRAWREADVAPMAEFFADGAASRYVGGPERASGVWRRVAGYIGHWAMRGYGVWALEDKQTGHFAGWSGVSFALGKPEPELQWTLVRQAQGRGLATEAAARARAFAYDVLGFTTLISLVAADNPRSERVAERLGARRERLVEVDGFPLWLHRHPGPGALAV
ncbi:MAG: GNAT family N-acetyltransferase [Rhizobiales bacterium]|nr:GNAT family N-acetyltransferase [Hyphomicrobiales bacterium]